YDKVNHRIKQINGSRKTVSGINQANLVNICGYNFRYARISVILHQIRLFKTDTHQVSGAHNQHNDYRGHNTWEVDIADSLQLACAVQLCRLIQSWINSRKRRKIYD